MRLADFIRTNREPILAEWVAFARTCTPASDPMDVTALRDHANAMLTAIADDLGTPQGAVAQVEKSRGHAPTVEGAPRTAAESHGTGRAQSGFTVAQMTAEYRALRASVVRLWTKAEGGALDATDIEDLTRFHEAIDQALAESVLRFNQDLEQSKEAFLAILGHDLRLPLGAIYTSAAFLLETSELQDAERALLTRIAGSATRSVGMVGALLDFTRSRLGAGIPVVRRDVELAKLLHDVVGEVASAHPDRTIRLDAHGPVTGFWDVERLGQALGNLVGNAVQHGDPGHAVTVTLSVEDDDAIIAVHNGGVIPAAQLDGIFNPMRTRLTPATPMPSIAPEARGPTGSLGLGLYIAERIIGAHEGRLDVTSAENEGTTFTVRLPRAQSQPGIG